MQKVKTLSLLSFIVIGFFVLLPFAQRKTSAGETILEFRHSSVENPYLYTDIYLNTSGIRVSSVLIDFNYPTSILEPIEINENPEFCKTSPEEIIGQNGSVKFSCLTYTEPFDATIATIKFRMISSGDVLLTFSENTSIIAAPTNENIFSGAETARYNIPSNFSSLPETGSTEDSSSFEALLAFTLLVLITLFLIIAIAIWGSIYLSLPLSNKTSAKGLKRIKKINKRSK